MAVIESPPCHASPDQAIKESLQIVEDRLEGDRDSTFFEVLGAEFRRLHARIRTHHAVACLHPPAGKSELPLEVQNEWTRLRDEHPRILGQLDWLIRHFDSVADQRTEDQDVFILRVRELIAVLRRHDAEEDRVLAVALWHDTGGES